MEKWTNLIKLKESGLVAVIRKPKENQAVPIAEALVEGGVGALEITVDTKGSYQLIERIKEKFGKEVLVGAGTVLDAETAKMAIDAGADFIFSPNFDEPTVRMANRYGKISIPGVMTPTEAVNAYTAGADLLKVFPGDSLNQNFIKNLQGPLSHIPVMPTGGITVDNAEFFIRSGAVALGVGGSLVDKKAIKAEDYGKLTEIARHFKAAIERGRSNEEE
ncbi:bifunctional 4-hydroxy-2-oxoglutarate aldolase/2-dehydro-3-deoxy-phosphogluconate aldolase [Sediminibacillus massiliensis]|uniref:bifunctional 4-hydroxy-2-oxoglutarate aldolase/2-dehydro-3-deoxy-phosphogluconate aldolase n=1 Tax=Sediminibacillus massiliensis TaxID=1926277 RepID=UPI00098860D4|nr:bifunctional 4-hydroxy-2-oxoglutarate aldolase/2-dehydro-3-deoxy-phosphogluconate aldolase [Sediminibacillus massiliensis]